MSQQSDIANTVYRRLLAGPVPMAHVVRELCSQWGAEHGVQSVHGFIREVVTCLLHHNDVEVGELKDGRFLPWSLPPWDADQKIDAELMAMKTFLSDESQYVFRKKPMA